MLHLETKINEFRFTNLEHFVLLELQMIDIIKQYYLQGSILI